MAKKTIKRPKRPGSDEIEEVEVDDDASAEGEIPSQLVPYPTGSPPDPMEEYYKANPERLPPVEASPPTPASAKAKAKAGSEEDDFDEPFKKGRK